MNDNTTIAVIVEGLGDKKSVPDLIRRILYERLNRYDLIVPQSKVAHGQTKLSGKLEVFLEYAIDDDCSAILVLLDADEGCPLEQVTELVERTKALNLGVPVAIVFAKSEYETWFICSLSEGTGEGIRARLGISEVIIAPDNVESVRDAKGWLTNNMPPGRAYRETIHQEPLTHHIDIDLTHDRSRSFRRLCHAIEELVQSMDNHISRVTPRPQ